VSGAALVLKEVGLYYRRGRRQVVVALAGVSLEVWPGEVVCVWAQRGRGKTALMRVAAGMEQPAGGRVWIGDGEVWALSGRRRARLLARRVGWVSCGPPELDVSVLAHVALPLRVAFDGREAVRRARETLVLVGVGECEEQRWASLSDAERARVALARAVVRDPALLVVDDLTMLLRGREADEIAGLLAGLARERELGVLASVSSMEETAWSDRLGTLAGGELLLPAADPERRLGKVLAFPGEAHCGRAAGRGVSA
jgi:ABC-type methionine transport system ATPase subunit